MIELAFVLSIIGAFTLGLYHRVIWDKVRALEANVVTKIKAKEELQPESTFIDPDDIVQVTRFEQAEIQRKLNPEQNAQELSQE